jgi:hypothetical protein
MSTPGLQLDVADLFRSLLSSLQVVDTAEPEVVGFQVQAEAAAEALNPGRYLFV